MTRPEDRQTLARDIAQACAEGARFAPACALVGIAVRTLRRWQAGDGLTRGDRRPDAPRPVPSHALSDAERARIVEVANEPRFAATPPARIQGGWFYLYLILDLYSRKVIGFEVYDTDSAEHAAHLARRTALAEGVHVMPARPVLHGDNGATLKATTVLAMLHWLGIKPSYSRPRVSDDNAFAEALFRTAKYRPEFPLKGFADLMAARQWAMQFVQWYNHEHRHSGIRYVTPAQRHAGWDRRLLDARHAVYQGARERNPRRWSGNTRNWTPVGAVTLNPERDAVVQAASQIRLSGSIGEPCFPVPTWQRQATERSEGDARSRATRSHAQRTSLREHGENGEHRTFSAVSTVAHSSPSEVRLLRAPVSTAQRLRQ